MKTFFIVLLSLTCIQSFSQIEYEYDNAGNRYCRHVIDISTQKVTQTDSTYASDSTIAERNEIIFQFSNESKITVFPNPATQFINIQTDNINSIEISIYEYSGKLLFTQISTDTWTSIDLSSMPYGNYIMSTVADGKRKEWKIIKN